MDVLFNEITKVINKQLPEFKWVDFDMGQLEINENPPVLFPCVLLDFSYPQNKGVKSANRMEMEVNFKVGFDSRGQTNNTTPTPLKHKAMNYIRVWKNLISKFNGLKIDNYAKFDLVSATPELLPTGIKIINISFTTKNNL